MKRKFLIVFMAVICALCLAFALTACGNGNSNNDGNNTEQTGGSETSGEAHTHSLTYFRANSASCTEDGNTAYWYCPSCSKYFSDENATNEISLSDTVISASHNIIHIQEVNATCTENGNIEYWYCNDCGKYFSDKSCTNEITASVTISATGHDATHIGYNAATCTKDGNIEYWYCSSCGKCFSDADATNEINHSTTVIAAEHSYDTNDVCSVCGRHKPTVGLRYTLNYTIKCNRKQIKKVVHINQLC